MSRWPEYLGPLAYGIKMGVILPGTAIEEAVVEALVRCHTDGLLGPGDVVCITESVVARAQGNYVTIDDVAGEITEKLGLFPGDRVGVVFPLASRNRFAMILRAIARATAGGEVVLLLSWPDDEVGNPLVGPGFPGVEEEEPFHLDHGKKLPGLPHVHPLTGVDYLALYEEIISREKAKPRIILSNEPLHALAESPRGIVVADIHSRFSTRERLESHFSNLVTLDQVCCEGASRSEWGLLGSNMSCGEMLKLAPRDGQQLVEKVKAMVENRLGLAVEVVIYGDGAYLDPDSGIYELADPRPALASTTGLIRLRQGVKYKLLADRCYYEDQKSAAEIEAYINASRDSDAALNEPDREGTTPRNMADLLASLADLVSGSADAGTPVVVVRGFLPSPPDETAASGSHT